MNAVELLKEDHEKVQSIYKRYQQANEQDHDQRMQCVREACTELELHTEIEEKSFYPAFQAKGTQQDKGLIDEAMKEHDAVGRMISEIKGMEGQEDKRSQVYTTFERMMGDVEHHVQEEESQVFPRAREIMGDEMDRLGDQMSQQKREGMQRAA